jgi:hypothetical protein
LLAEISADLLKCASDFTMHLLKVGLGAIPTGNKSHSYWPVHQFSDLPDCFPVSTLDLVALDRRAMMSRNKDRVAELIRFLPNTSMTWSGEPPSGRKKLIDFDAALQAESARQFISCDQLIQSIFFCPGRVGGPVRDGRLWWPCGNGSRGR